MTRPGSARAPKGAAGRACRRSRRRAARRPEWCRLYRRAQRALDAAAKLILETIITVEEAADRVERRPLRTARRLTRAIRQMVAASLRLFEARRELAEAQDCLDRSPEPHTGDAQELLELAAERCRAVARGILVAASEVIDAQREVIAGFASGELVPEHPSDSRPRIIVTPLPRPVRAFLAARQPRVSDRITPILLRRRRTLLPAEIRVPRRHLRGRAPPLPSPCLL